MRKKGECDMAGKVCTLKIIHTFLSTFLPNHKIPKAMYLPHHISYRHLQYRPIPCSGMRGQKFHSVKKDSGSFANT